MSANKGFDTKIPDDENTDSGFLSGPIDRLPGDEEEEAQESGVLVSDSGDVKSVERVEKHVGLDLSRDSLRADSSKVKSVDKVEQQVEQNVDLDSGVDLCLSECLDSLRVSDPAPALPEAAVIPPLAFLFQQDDDGDSQLHIAAVHGCQVSVSTLIRVCPDRNWLDLPNDFGHTALQLAAMSGNAAVTRMLLQAGASIGLRDLKGDTPIHTATRTKNVECLQALLIPIEQQRLPKNLATILNLKNYEGQTCVHLAATLGNIPALQTLVYFGADINAREGLAGWTALHIAARRGDLRLAQYLLERCAGVARHARDYAGRTPRRLAARNPAFSAREGQKLFKVLAEDSDTETDSEDEYDSDDPETLFDKIRGSMTTAVVTN